jgi:aryl-alcohol dehydrogenase-like predicted oxidoreductase
LATPLPRSTPTRVGETPCSRWITIQRSIHFQKLAAWAQERERGPNELAEAWLLAEPAVCSVISGATRVEHVLSNAKAADWVLTGEEVKEIRSILEAES